MKRQEPFPVVAMKQKWTVNRQTGGITGYNEGTVSDCTNSGKINTNQKVVKEYHQRRGKHQYFDSQCGDWYDSR